MAGRPTDGRGKICVAQIGAAHGLKGEVRVRIFTADPDALAGYGPLQTIDGRTLVIDTIRLAKDHFVARFAGVEDRDAAQALRNRELYVSRDRLPEPGEGEFYHADLAGLAVVDRADRVLGRVVALHNFGAGDILEVALDARGDTVLLPFSEQVVPDIDIAGGRLVIDPPEGALDAPIPKDRRSGS